MLPVDDEEGNSSNAVLGSILGHFSERLLLSLVLVRQRAHARISRASRKYVDVSEVLLVLKVGLEKVLHQSVLRSGAALSVGLPDQPVAVEGVADLASVAEAYPVLLSNLFHVGNHGRHPLLSELGVVGDHFVDSLAGQVGVEFEGLPSHVEAHSFEVGVGRGFLNGFLHSPLADEAPRSDCV